MPRREWTDEERAYLEATPQTWPRNRKVTDEQVNEIRQRVDSLTTPYTLKQIAKDYGITVQQVTNIARRKDWKHRVYEPAGRWWLEVEREERARERERRRLLEERSS